MLKFNTMHTILTPLMHEVKEKGTASPKEIVEYSWYNNCSKIHQQFRTDLGNGFAELYIYYHKQI